MQCSYNPHSYDFSKSREMGFEEVDRIGTEKSACRNGSIRGHKAFIDTDSHNYSAGSEARALKDEKTLIACPLTRTDRPCSGPEFFVCQRRQLDSRRRGNPLAEASAPGGSRNGSTGMRS